MKTLDVKNALRYIEHYQMIMGEPMSSYMAEVAKQIRKLEEENRALRTELTTNRKPDTKADDQQAKSDAGKPRLTLVPPRIIWDIAAVRQYGVEVKYPKTGVDGWRTISMERIKDAAFRHFMRYLATPHGVDEESGLSHLWHCATNIAFLCELEDDRD